ncbi:hypothetical protein EKG37_20620 [Robertmurraya yapensis]|uniref:Uncharacterized protein n=1 Tax=Bacillus yapensis TaxID=2492960 RepID=A0A431VU76_9BACI|nr:hypothetical protein [Bacillus yapensis]RTR26713.1 hypothetical protein EKG37_20620 [Bacillus yapensis]TKS93801.1 hypothetical protein FAR12_20625 [Bacillus yapensis]
MLTLNQEIISESLNKVGPGLEKYIRIQTMFYNVNVNKSEEFQRIYNGYYRMRQRPRAFYDTYYEFLEKSKVTEPSFESTLKYLYNELGRVEASFASKLVATVNPSKPVWDSVVLKNLRISPPSYYDKNRMKKIIDKYNSIEEWYITFLTSEEGRLAVKLFDEKFNNKELTSLKKLDLILWQIRS